MSSDRAIDPPTVVGHKPVALTQPRAPAGALDDPPTTRLAPEPARARAAAPASFGAPSRSQARMEPPQPGRPSPADRESPPAAAVAPISEPTDPSDVLAAAAAPLLSLVAQLRDTVDFADVERLRSEVINEVRKFEEAAVRNGAAASDVQAARYVLCSLIDETVMTTPWGSASDWSTNSLLNRFHNETWGGEKVFAILDRAKTDPRGNIALLKLVDLVLLLGFEGMHRVLDNGRERLSDLREELGRLVTQHLPTPQAELSGQWRGVAADRTLRTFFPLWIVFAAAGLLLVCLYGYHRYRLSVEVAAPLDRMRALESLISPGVRVP